MSEDSCRQWKEDKRSWIFYRKEIEKNPNIVQGEVDGNSYIFDCETARLSIWSEKWNTFVEVGVSSLVEAVDTRTAIKKRDTEAKIRVFYKGIELDNKRIKRDFAILESIDIKGELQREYMNINRGSFTAKGEVFFEEELYPGLLDVVRKVLRYLTETTSLEDNQIDSRYEKSRKNFANIIPRIVEEKCNKIIEIREKKKKESKELDDNIKELRTLAVVVSVLAYFAMLDEWNVSEQLHKEASRSYLVWGELVQNIDSILSKSENEIVLNELASSTKFFRIKVYDENYLELFNEQNFRYRFTQFFLPQNHWGILQIRKNKFGVWMSYPILLNNDNLNYSNLVLFPHNKEYETKLKKWGNELCSVVNQFDDQEDSNQQFLVNWLLKNIPTVAMFCDTTGNIRVNILANRIYPSIFMNDNFKCLLLERILIKAKNDGIQRFSTITWQGYESQACKRLPFNVYFVKRGFFSSYAYYKSILPFDSSLLNKFADAIFSSKDEQSSIIKLIESVDIANCLKVSLIKGVAERNGVSDFLLKADQTNSMWTMVARISEVIVREMEKMHFTPTKKFEELLEWKCEDELKWVSVYSYILQQKMRMEKDNQDFSILSDFKQEEAIEYLCNTWIYLLFGMDDIISSISEINVIYEKHIKEDFSYQIKIKRLIDYLRDNVPYGFEIEEIRQHIKCFEGELLKLLCDMEQRNIFDVLEKLKASNGYLVEKARRKMEVRKDGDMRK